MKKEEFTSSKKHFLLAIENTDYDYLYGENETYKTIAKCFLNDVIRRTAYNLNNGINDHTNLKWSSKILNKIYGKHYAKVLKEITSKILFRTSYEVGKKSRSYYLNDSNIDRNVVVTHLDLSKTKARNVVEKIKKHRINKDQELAFLNKFFDSRKLKIDFEKIYGDLKENLNFKSGGVKSILRFSRALDFHQGNHFFKYDKKKTQRLYTSFTILKKEDRKLVTYEGNKLVEIDIKNSIPTIFSLLLNNSINIDYKKLFTKNSVLLNYILMFVENSKHIDIIEIEEFQKLCLNGEIYDFLNVDFQKTIYQNHYDYVYSMMDDEDNLDTRKLTKKEFISMLFANNDTFLDMEILFEKKFPSISKFILNIKEENYKYLSYILFSIESEIMIKIIAKEFNRKQNGKAPLFTIHDCICTTHEYAEELKEFIHVKFQEITGHYIKLDIDYN